MGVGFSLFFRGLHLPVDWSSPCFVDVTKGGVGCSVDEKWMRRGDVIVPATDGWLCAV